MMGKTYNPAERVLAILDAHPPQIEGNDIAVDVASLPIDSVKAELGALGLNSDMPADLREILHPSENRNANNDIGLDEIKHRSLTEIEAELEQLGLDYRPGLDNVHAMTADVHSPSDDVNLEKGEEGCSGTNIQYRIKWGSSVFRFAACIACFLSFSNIAIIYYAYKNLHKEVMIVSSNVDDLSAKLAALRSLPDKITVVSDNINSLSDKLAPLHSLPKDVLSVSADVGILDAKLAAIHSLPVSYISSQVPFPKELATATSKVILSNEDDIDRKISRLERNQKVLLDSKRMDDIEYQRRLVSLTLKKEGAAAIEPAKSHSKISKVPEDSAK